VRCGSLTQYAAAAGGESFRPTLDTLRSRFNANPEADPIVRAQSELGNVKDILTQNVEQILSRGEQIELLMGRTDSVAHQSLAFRRRAVSLRREMWWRNTRIVALTSVCVVVRCRPFGLTQTLLFFVFTSLFGN